MRMLLFAVGLLLVMRAASESPEASLTLGADYAMTPADMPRVLPKDWSAMSRPYAAFGAWEWQVRVAGRVSEGTSADFVVRFADGAPVTLRWSRGSHSETADFEPKAQVLAPGAPVVIESFGGRSSDGAMPYFNLDNVLGGVILAIGWTGDWRAEFSVAEGGGVHVKMGLKAADFTLPEGERLKFPSLLAMPYAGDWIDGRNKFRRLMLAHFVQQNHPPAELMPVAASVHGMIGFNDTTEENLVALAKDIGATKLPVDTFWLDAGWNEGGFAAGQGSNQPDPKRFPQGLAPVGAAANAAGLRFLTWFEPERVMRGTTLDREHADWLLYPSDSPKELKYQENDGFRLLNLGNSDARAWATQFVGDTIASSHIAIYRQDFNLYPGFFWHTDEPANERGLREVRYINGLYAYLDALQQRFPALIMDNCASGGRRLDFEMMRRMSTYWRSDSCWDSKEYPRNVQAMAHAFAQWLPLHGLGAASVDTVALRSGMGACGSYANKFRDPVEVEALRGFLTQYLPVRELYWKDYYPLTEWSVDPKAWLAWQYHDPETGRGSVQAFCSDTAGAPGPVLKLRGLKKDGWYKLVNWDDPQNPQTRSGAELMGQGVAIKATRGSDAVVVGYTPVR